MCAIESINNLVWDLFIILSIIYYRNVSQHEHRNQFSKGVCLKQNFLRSWRNIYSIFVELLLYYPVL